MDKPKILQMENPVEMPTKLWDTNPKNIKHII